MEPSIFWAVNVTFCRNYAHCELDLKINTMAATACPCPCPIKNLTINICLNDVGFALFKWRKFREASTVGNLKLKSNLWQTERTKEIEWHWNGAERSKRKTDFEMIPPMKHFIVIQQLASKPNLDLIQFNWPWSWVFIRQTYLSCSNIDSSNLS